MIAARTIGVLKDLQIPVQMAERLYESATELKKLIIK